VKLLFLIEQKYINKVVHATIGVLNKVVYATMLDKSVKTGLFLRVVVAHYCVCSTRLHDSSCRAYWVQ